MKPSKIKVGKTYRNRGKGTTTRTVLAIGLECQPERWFGIGGIVPVNELGVLYVQSGKEYRAWLCSFATWAGARVYNHDAPPNRETRDGSPVARPVE